MTEWGKSMQQTFEFFEVDAETWKDKQKLNNFLSAQITRDFDAETLGYATFEVDDVIAECYVRVYLVTIQNDLKERHELGVYMVQSPSSVFDGKVQTLKMDGYTPLIELKEKLPPLGYTVRKGQDIINASYNILTENMRSPVVFANDTGELLNRDMTANIDDNWLLYVSDLLKEQNYCLTLDENSRAIFEPIISVESMQPIYEFNDGNSSLLLPAVNIEFDIFEIPNVVEVIYTAKGRSPIVKRAKNIDATSITSIPSRGREVVYRETNPAFTVETNADMDERVQKYAEDLLKEKSQIETTITYEHGFCPVRVGDCVRLNYQRAGLDGIKVRVIKQVINCETGCTVQETAVYTESLWG